MQSSDTAVTHTEKRLRNNPFLAKKFLTLRERAQEPFRGVTTDGEVIPSLYNSDEDGDFDIEQAVTAGTRLLQQCSRDDQDKLLRPLDSSERRSWFNPEIYFFHYGLRLDEIEQPLRDAVFSLMEATLSPAGYDKALKAMRVNHFLGEICHLPLVLNQYSYNFVLFEQPSPDTPWGWMLSGHHLCLSAFLHKSQVIISPTFTGAEPNSIDDGPWKGTTLLSPEQDLGLLFMRRLPLDMQKKAQIFKTMGPPEIPESRWDLADQRHLCGAFQDNRVVPYEGVCLAGLLDNDAAATVDLLLDIVDQFHLYLPATARRNRLQQVRRHIRDTYFCWIGGFGDGDAFYYRIQSPVIVCEFDHHAGVFLTNEEPARFHIHTITRMPNGGDYGFAILEQLER
ncbi:hypothetical protein M406DRAFT_337913 [Cryphonectria parasitica EP155]|uniref:DUF3500 domain-containing protein n=1 Tax=Cryphonectria parasitica (strain ATCC 38755 / EP155) TaxID=660469 RepID=A0A9P4Y4Y5_CRYP1|nr:uncharacterized protein M406DRAFT_337913 [Cryphonectria parasitica EP155]KAF3767034.1 hypothetical protein M406DRAFT_337913 [Cryphonectria parasitica EP155]